jgi:E3 ubiquitin-protein ligase EDD1
MCFFSLPLLKILSCPLFKESSAQLFSALELTFAVDLSAEEGGGSVELVPNGREVEVNATNIYSYVRKYSQYR